MTAKKMTKEEYAAFKVELDALTDKTVRLAEERERARSTNTLLPRLTLVDARNTFAACAELWQRTLEDDKAEKPVDEITEAFVQFGIQLAEKQVKTIQTEIDEGQYLADSKPSGEWLPFGYEPEGLNDYENNITVDIKDNQGATRSMPLSRLKAIAGEISRHGVFLNWRPSFGNNIVYRPDSMPEGKEWRPFESYEGIIATYQHLRPRFGNRAHGKFGPTVTGAYFYQAKEIFDRKDVVVLSARLATLAETNREQDKTEEVKTKSVKTKPVKRSAPSPWSAYTTMLQEEEAEEAEEQQTKTVKRSASHPNSLLFETLREDEEDDRFSQTRLLWRPRSACVDGMEWIPWKVNDETVWVLHSDGTVACGTADLLKWSWRENSWDPDYDNIIACWRFTDDD